MPAPLVPRDDDPSSPILQLDKFPQTGTPIHEKKNGYDLFAAMGSPKHVVAPMVDQSELAWRILSRRYDSHLVYTPMINARQFTNRIQGQGSKTHMRPFWISTDAEKQEEGQVSITRMGKALGTDRPLIVQFAGHDPDVLLSGAQIVQDHCDAVDLNLGCPQDIARRGHYGSFLQSDWQLIFRLINTLHLQLRIPVTAKMRVFESTERTVAYALMMERAGAQIITVHGRTREMKGHKTGLADWEKIKAVKKAVKVPVFANGNVLFQRDVEKALKLTGADGIMSAEGNLYNPALFCEPPSEATKLYPLAPIYPFPRLTMLVAEYLDICIQLETPTASSAVKSHLFRLSRPAMEIHRDLRPVLGKCATIESEKGKPRYAQFYAFLEELSKRLERDEKDEKYTSNFSAELVEFEAKEGDDPIYIPHWLAQPYYRKTLPPTDEAEEAKQARRQKRALRVEQTEGLTNIDDIQTKGENLNQEEENPDKRLRAILEEAVAIKEKANALFLKKQYDDAIVQYTEVIGVLPVRSREVESEHDTEDGQQQIEGVRGKGKAKDNSSLIEERDPSDKKLLEKVCDLRAVVFANLAACYLCKKAYKEAAMACNESLQDDPLYLKALNRRAQANEEIGTWSSLTSSLEDYNTMNRMIHPASLQPSISAALKRLPGKIAISSEKEKEEMMGKLKGIGDNVLGYFGLSTKNFQMQKGEGGGYSLNFVR